MHQSNSLLIDYVKRKLQLEVETSSFLEFIHQQQNFFGVKSLLWIETGAIYLYSIVFSICNNKDTDLFFQLIERELQRKSLTEITEIFGAFELTTDKLKKLNAENKVHSNSVALDVSFQVSILVKVLENKLEIMLINFLEEMNQANLQKQFSESIANDQNINTSVSSATEACEYLINKFS